MLQLTVPGEDEARWMLAASLPDDRVAVEPAAAGEILALCGRLPLALALVGAPAADQPGVPLATVAGQFSSGLADFPTDDEASNISSLLDCSRVQTRRLTCPDEVLGKHNVPAVLAGAVPAGRRRPETRIGIVRPVASMSGRCWPAATAGSLPSWKPRDDKTGADWIMIRFAESSVWSLISTSNFPSAVPRCRIASHVR